MNESGVNEHGIRASWPGTIGILVACVVSLFISGQDLVPSRMAQLIAYVILGGIVFSILMDWRHGLKNLIRVDIFALLALYFLLYFEFLFPQSRFDNLAVPVDVIKSIHLTLIGLGSMVVGRHLVPHTLHTLGFVGEVKLSKHHYVLLLVGSFLIANLYMWLAVSFNPVDWITELMGPRFSQPWMRGRLGNAAALLNELALMGYVVPPLAGYIFAHRKDYNVGILLLVVVCLLLQLFVAFAGGTRNIFAMNLASLLGGYLIVQPKLKIRSVIIGGLVVVVVFTIAAEMMLDFRNVGMSRYFEEGMYRPAYQEFQEDYLGQQSTSDTGYFVDYNLYNISQLVSVFPNSYEFLGWNLPYVALTKPVPRALWPSKPEGLDVGLEEAVGAVGFTISCTFIGEAYVSGGMVAVLVTGLIVGLFCGWWNQLALYTQSPLALVLYASGFFAILITMRSLMFFTTALLPAIALIVLARILFFNQKSKGLV